MVIDWECSRFTKTASPMTAKDTYLHFVNVKYKNTPYEKRLKEEILPILEKLNL
jgi:hypothetical protein